MALVVKNPSANAGDARDQRSSLRWEDPLEKEMQPTPVFLPGKSHGGRSLGGHSPWGRQVLDRTEYISPLLFIAVSPIFFLFFSLIFPMYVFLHNFFFLHNFK